MSLPLPPGFFECPPLSSLEATQLRLLADQVCTDAIATALATAKLPTTKVMAHPRTKRLHWGTDLYRSEIDAVTGVSQIATSYDQLHTFYDVATPKQLRTFGTVASQTLLDRVVLYSLEQSRSTSFRVTSILWAAMQSTLLGKGVLAKRDTCYLECLRDVAVVDESGQVMERIVGEMLNLEDYFCADDVQSRLVRQRRLSSPAPYRANASYCDVCFGAFKLLSQKLQCYFCHQIACTKCAHVHVATSTLVTKKVRVCTNCYCPPTDAVARRTSLSDDMARSAIYTVRGGCVVPSPPHDTVNDNEDKIVLLSSRALPKLAQEPRRVRSGSTDSTASGSDAFDRQSVGIFGLDTARTALESMSSFGSYATTVVGSSVRIRTG
ncbi:hypothetical protein SDRG_14251 [Saprolegnia diclina VS20]|uniref:FYVE-type domain-containing protein n=1 Tax=Saprolegnia diclina (strain VS20) TaxID=1156394 RepID=T0Q3L1_SAPDV|nr:hypothetical protein SDRG_14251 [Saprolegnia diclina VS20]EQC27975.1 hypothetical protein SDRG_14251 [Saprolegnia diclina VS20]|eukprot:XP_008618588.1 hypothetical protein SDRG_14251 [Saprolegnia diclina VS20]